jgi:hypothetical protein
VTPLVPGAGRFTSLTKIVGNVFNCRRRGEKKENEGLRLMEKKKRDTDNFCYPLPWRVVVAVAVVAVVERRFVNKTFLGVQSTLVFVPTGSVFYFLFCFSSSSFWVVFSLILFDPF